MHEIYNKIDIHKNNNFDLIRLLASIGVFLSHGSFFYNGELFSFLGNTQSLGSISVCVFFVISGYLINESLKRNSEIKNFFIKRFFRIFPALWLAAFFSVYVVGFFSSKDHLSNYFYRTDVWNVFSRYFFAIADEHQIIGVFENNIFPRAINGSLWTIKYEILMYVLLLFVFLIFYKFRTIAYAMVLSGAALAYVWYGASLQVAVGVLVLKDIVFFVLCFFYGAILSGWQAAQWRSAGLVLGAVMAGAAATWAEDRFVKDVCLVLCVGMGVLVAAFKLPGFPLRHDISYGVYIYAFPLQQWVTEIALAHQWSKAVCMFLSLLAVLVCAWLSWVCVERKCIALGQRLAPANKRSALGTEVST